MKTYKELKDFCEAKNVRFEVNPLYSKPYEYLGFENGKAVWKQSRTFLGYEIGMCNIAGRNGRSEWQWVWFETICFKEEEGLKDETAFFFRERYSQVNGQSYKSFREGWNAEKTIERRMN